MPLVQPLIVTFYDCGSGNGLRLGGTHLDEGAERICSEWRTYDLRCKSVLDTLVLNSRISFGHLSPERKADL